MSREQFTARCGCIIEVNLDEFRFAIVRPCRRRAHRDFHEGWRRSQERKKETKKHVS